MSNEEQFQEKRAGLITRSAYVLTNDIKAVALYRSMLGIISMLLLGMVSYFGDRIVRSQDDLRTDVSQVRIDIVELKRHSENADGATIKSDERINDLDTRLNTLDKNVIELQTNMNFVLRKVK